MRYHADESHQDWLAKTNKEIDRLRRLVVDDGWTKVNFPHGYRDSSHVLEVEVWCEENCGMWDKFGRTFYFKEEKDASMFLLKFS